MKNIKVKHLFYAIVFLTLMTIMNTCNSCQSNVNSKKAFKETDTLTQQVIILQKDIQNIENAMINDLDLQIQGLKTEKRMLINTNQIFLTKLRPDERILEIDKEIQEIEKDKQTHANNKK